MSKYLLRLTNIKQLVQVCNQQEKYKVGRNQNTIAIIENGCIVVDMMGKIVFVDTMENMHHWYTQQPQPIEFEQEYDLTNKCIVPGLVDGHTHPVWSGNRVDEFAMKLAGATYLEIHEQGGGIHRTVQATQQSTEEELSKLLHHRLNRMLSFGTTLLEAKSGYGLDLDTELKMLRVLHAMEHPIDIVSNYLGAHAIPQGMTASDATKNIVEKHLGTIAKDIEKGTISPQFIDVFCEKGVFEYEDTKAILQAGKQYGLDINFHGDEIHPMLSGKLGAEVGAVAISHLEMIDDDDIQSMAHHSPPIHAVVLPTTKYILNLPCPPVRKLIESKVPVALGSDFNPNAHCLSMPMTMHFACILFKMTMKESLVAATINAAASIKKSDLYGSLEVGKFADMIVLGAQQWEHLIYEMVDPPIEAVLKNGIVQFGSLV